MDRNGNGAGGAGVSTLVRMGRSSEELPPYLHLDLTIEDADTIAELWHHPDGEPREEFALRALRIGVLALRQARGEVDAERVRREADRLIEMLEVRLGEHAQGLNDRLTAVLSSYFDPADGRFEERVNRLIRKDGELEAVLRRHVGDQDSQLCRTLSQHIGDGSPLLKMLSPDQSTGLLALLRSTVDEQLAQQREQVLAQFSLDNKGGALCRFIDELSQRHDAVATELNTRIEQVVRQFSLDHEDSALSRLVSNVERAQRTITNEFSLDQETSALSRLRKMLECTNSAIEGHLSLDVEDSALARLKRELLGLLEGQREVNQKFQEEVKTSLAAMVARKQESERSTRHGIEFEEAVFLEMQDEAQRLGDIATRAGNTVGLIKNCKVGDCISELGPESAAPGGRIVVEAKEKDGYSLASAREEIEKARKNRGAQIGLFIFSKNTAPRELQPLTRYGHDVFVVWDPCDPATQVYLRAAYSLARGLCVRSHALDSGRTADFESIDRAVLEIEKQAAALDDVRTWTETVRNNAQKILDKTGAMRRSLEDQVEILRQKTTGLKEMLVESADQ